MAPPAVTVAPARTPPVELRTVPVSVPVSHLLCSRRFGVPAPAAFTRPIVVLVSTASPTLAGVADGFAARCSAATPATCGAAIEVPLAPAVAPFDVW